MNLILLNSDSIDLIDMLMKNEEIFFTEKLMDKAISNNRIESVKWIHHNTTVGCTNRGVQLAYILESSMIEWLHQNRTESDDSEFIKSNLHQFSQSIRSFIVYNIPELIPSNILEIINGDFKLSKYIHDNSLLDISKFGNIESVKYLHEYYNKHGINQETNHFDINSFKQTLLFSIKNKYMDIVK